MTRGLGFRLSLPLLAGWSRNHAVLCSRDKCLFSASRGSGIGPNTGQSI